MKHVPYFVIFISCLWLFSHAIHVKSTVVKPPIKKYFNIWNKIGDWLKKSDNKSEPIQPVTPETNSQHNYEKSQQGYKRHIGKNQPIEHVTQNSRHHNNKRHHRESELDEPENPIKHHYKRHHRESELDNPSKPKKQKTYHHHRREPETQDKNHSKHDYQESQNQPIEEGEEPITQDNNNHKNDQLKEPVDDDENKHPQDMKNGDHEKLSRRHHRRESRQNESEEPKKRHIYHNGESKLVKPIDEQNESEEPETQHIDRHHRKSQLVEPIEKNEPIQHEIHHHRHSVPKNQLDNKPIDDKEEKPDQNKYDHHQNDEISSRHKHKRHNHHKHRKSGDYRDEIETIEDSKDPSNGKKDESYENVAYARSKLMEFHKAEMERIRNMQNNRHENEFD